MNLEEKIKRLKELSNIKFPSDQDIEEMTELKENIRLELADTIPKFEHPTEEKPEPKQYRGIISGRIQKWREQKKEKNKATPEMLRQLELEARKAELEARINIAKEKKQKHRPKRFDFSIPGKIFTDAGEKEHQSMKRKLGDNHDDKDYSVLGI